MVQAAIQRLEHDVQVHPVRITEGPALDALSEDLPESSNPWTLLLGEGARGHPSPGKHPADLGPEPDEPVPRLRLGNGPGPGQGQEEGEEEARRHARSVYFHPKTPGRAPRERP